VYLPSEGVNKGTCSSLRWIMATQNPHSGQCPKTLFISPTFL